MNYIADTPDLKVFVEVKGGLPINVDVQNAIDGFEYLAYKIIPVTMTELLVGKYDMLIREYPFVGSIDFMKKVFKRQKKTPLDIDFPEQILKSGLLNRKITKTTLGNAIEYLETEAVSGDKIELFIKPVETKLFDGILINSQEKIVYNAYFHYVDKLTPVWMCEKIKIISEHRAYVYNGKIIYCCNYSGDFRINPDYGYIDKLISIYSKSPMAYTIDIAILDDGSNTVVEFNDMWSIGGYGMSSCAYAKMLRDRYFEIIK